MSEWKVEAVQLRAEWFAPHPNADRLEIVNVHGGYPCLVMKGQFRPGDLAVYVPVDSEVPVGRTDSPAFAFLADGKKDRVRIKAKRLRGVFSMGVLVATEGTGSDGRQWYFGNLTDGDDVASLFSITKYEPDEANRRPGRGGGSGLSGGTSERCPLPIPTYTDLDSLRRGHSLEEGEEVVICEKIHGSNSRYVHDGRRLWVSSHYHWKRPPREVSEEETAQYERAFRRHHGWFRRGLRALGLSRAEEPVRPVPVKMTEWWKVAIDYGLEEKLRAVPNMVVCGEVYGQQDLKYGLSPGQLGFVAFDAYDINRGQYLDYDDFTILLLQLKIPTAPQLYRGPWSPDLKTLAEGKTCLPGAPDTHIREGFVVRPVLERRTEKGSRVIYKLVGESYLLR